ncbi:MULTISPECIES: alpha/beta fold hydrolase [Halomonas]|uniref:alpha/beta fold hydrolase n=1 Tax=Halomonas TaxID=2745 RepID=UPI001C94F44F|nr:MULTISPECIES: alpha/beta fold hydrolase [Halomonas]MBY6208632.1 alpha/beta hydrolase [Halomonas sp. DP3Y7-2]MBY6227103.1 alpha/beta hydrolase [Halomonas sp. DP3Y7-1]MCA0915148.1 alpha/beta hydrolase [Halomonas denitrificans]
MSERVEFSVGDVSAISQGEGEVVLLISGLGGEGHFWLPVMRHLSDVYRVISFDHPGVARSRSRGVQRIDEICRVALDILDQEGVGRAHVVGHSTGSLVAQALGLDQPERIQSLVLSSGWSRTDRRFRKLFELRKQVLKDSGGQAYRTLGNLLAFPSALYSQFDFPPANFSDSQVEVMLARIDMLLGYSRHDELGELNAPTLVVGAEDDWIVPFHHAEELAGAIGGARLETLNGGHFTPKTRPEAYATLLESFFRGCA